MNGHHKMHQLVRPIDCRMRNKSTEVQGLLQHTKTNSIDTLIRHLKPTGDRVHPQLAGLYTLCRLAISSTTCHESHYIGTDRGMHQKSLPSQLPSHNNFELKSVFPSVLKSTRSLTYSGVINIIDDLSFAIPLCPRDSPMISHLS